MTAPDAVALPKPCLCPSCGALLEASSAMRGKARPAPGDCTMCLHCGLIMIYEPDLMVRVAMAEDIAKMPQELLGQLMAMQIAQRITKAVEPPKVETKH